MIAPTKIARATLDELGIFMVDLLNRFSTYEGQVAANTICAFNSSDVANLGQIKDVINFNAQYEAVIRAAVTKERARKK